MITTIVLAAALSDIESLHKSFSESEQLIVQQCIDKPDTCEAAAQADMAFLKSMEGNDE